MTIDISIVDRMSQRLEKAAGKWYARTYDGATIVYEDEITGYTGGTVPSEINDVYSAQRTAVLLGGRQVVSNTNLLTGRSVILGSDTATIGALRYLNTPRMQKGLQDVKNGVADLIICFRGDSTFAGVNGLSSSVPQRIAEHLRSCGYVVSTDCLNGSHFVGGVVTEASVLAYYQGKLTFSAPGEWMTGASNVTFGGTPIYNSTVGSTSSFTWQPELPYDSVIVGVVGSSGAGSHLVSKGGVALGAVVNAITGSASEVVNTYSALSDKSNAPITFKKTAGGFVQSNLIWCKSSTEKRVYIVNAARGSAKIADFIATTYPFEPRNIINNTIAPHVMINHLGINDVLAATDTTTVQANATTLIDEDYTAGRDSVWMTPAPIGLANANSSAANQRAMANAYRAACRDTGAPLLDLMAAVKAQAVNAALYTSTDTVHWSTLGDAYVANVTLGGLSL